MKHISCACIDAGTSSCPCPLAETGDCLVCSRLAGRDKCDCSWCGLCIYNEFVQNGARSASRRQSIEAPIISRRWYSSDLVTIELNVGKSFALNGIQPGSFVFLNGTEDPYFDTPVSIMRVDIQRGTLLFALKVISAKTKAIAHAEGRLYIRGVYRNGLLGEGSIRRNQGGHAKRPLHESARCLFLTKGVGFAPAVNIIDRLPEKAKADMVIDTEKITEEIVSENLSVCDAVRGGRVNIDILPLNRLLDKEDAEASRCVDNIGDYDKVFILASDYYIDALAAVLNVSESKLIYANNFHMCCGEGLCGACCHVDERGIVRKMCKCRSV